MVEIFKRKLYYIILQFSFFYCYAIAYLFSSFFRKKKEGEKKRIAAIWYYPLGLTGSNLRMGEWKKFFEDDGYIYDNYYACKFEEYLSKYENGTWSSKYNFYRIILLRRLKQFLALRKYDIVWIDRGFLPYYPLKKPFFEKCIKKLGIKLVMDSTDGGDFQLNPKLVFETLFLADRITVAYKYLNELYGTMFQGKVHWVNWTIPTDKYIVKKTYSIKSKPIIGWMGSPGNAKAHLLPLQEVFINLSKKQDFKLVYICREKLDLNIPGIEVEHKTFGDDYYELVASFDIGVCPFLEVNIRTKGKIAMKNQEFMLCGIPQVCSPVATSEHLIHNDSALVAHSFEDWEASIEELIINESKRQKLGENSLKLFERYYLYESEYQKLASALAF